MPKLENDIAGLKTVLYLLGESVRVSDERGLNVIAAKISECAQIVQAELDGLSTEQQYISERLDGDALHRNEDHERTRNSS